MLTDLETRRLLDHRFGGPSVAREVNLYLGLHVGASPPSLAEGTGFVEPGGGTGYTRITMANSAESWTAAAMVVAGPHLGSVAKFNAMELQFPVASAPWGIPTHAGLFVGASSGVGVPVAIATFTQPYGSVAEGSLVRFTPGALMLLLRREP